MARPASETPTPRELELLQVYWAAGEPLAAEEARQGLAEHRDRHYATVRNLVLILVDKGYLQQTNYETPYLHAPARSRDEVTRAFVSDLVERVFQGSRGQLLEMLLEDRQLTDEEHLLLQRAIELGSPPAVPAPGGISAAQTAMQNGLLAASDVGPQIAPFISPPATEPFDIPKSAS
jgi:predicted transcriptional regulator